MKLILRYTLFSALFLFLQCKPSITIENIIPNSTEDFSYANKTKTLVSAHRGGSGLENYPENCIETMEFLYQKGINIFEIDISSTQDKQLILMHDNSLQRTTTARQDVNQVSLSTIKKYFLMDDFGNQTDYQVPTFEEALQWGKDKMLYFMVDIKKTVDYQQLIDVIRKNKMEQQCILVSYSVGQAEKLHRLAPEMMLSVNMRNERELNDLLESDIPSNRMIAFTGTRLSDKSLYQKIHQEDIMVILGTLGNLDKQAEKRGNSRYQEYEKMGVDIFATDRPLAVLETINK
ncbi:glycerophosphodiester phosphodiesterase family protein [Weeksella virosa]|uniref:Glycerophosphoryl diester phosphodiesterase n=1 Tax=Weeksella virosa (strain ATCC 43766 / DSM 16922 / JCM 21250 / CCUG 30538 / CDC 9751 / IAM 14551 / NBRC 16016 / NCTC 11634 / CL345/78) TaxID=865938 RepID=F0P026_WEEVC|nr:glycerophosphodiester phosphodiesterase family protein [Weeksella virosa]ADX67373.1 glycerophosphoryl diester phosphodiesterase [Weeksella virosa DSM 16922]VEH62889.1 cytoplasmic glycerophosphodiester phosphodiesterase [Weeksella virosa]